MYLYWSSSPLSSVIWKMGSTFRRMLFLLFCALISNNVKADIVINEVERTVDLTSQLAKISTTITLENKGDSPVKEFSLTFLENELKHLSFLEVVVSTYNFNFRCNNHAYDFTCWHVLSRVKFTSEFFWNTLREKLVCVISYFYNNAGQRILWSNENESMKIRFLSSYIRPN